MAHIFDEKNSVLNKYIAQIRDEEIQKDSMRFRRNIERIGELAAYEISKTLNYKKTEVVTPLGISDVYVPSDEIVIASVMRAGLPLHNGFLNIFDNAENAFISAYRKYHDDNSFEIRSEYISAPSIEGKTLIFVDPMLATGASILVAYKALLKKGKPKHTYSSSIRPDITKTPVPMWSLINLNNYSYFRTKIKFFPRIALFLMILNLVFFIKSFNSK